MKIAIIGDTHLRKHYDKLINYINKHFNDIDLIIHTGDYTSKEVIDCLERSHKFVGVYGNNDKDKLRSLLPNKQIISLEGYKAGICHGDGPKKQTLDNAIETFKNDKVDIIIYGHSHQPTIFTKKKILFLNPGSLTSKRKEKWASYILLNIDEHKNIDATIKFII